jgi:hypothetical protein
VLVLNRGRRVTKKKKTRVSKISNGSRFSSLSKNGGHHSLSNRYRKETLVAHKP